MTTAEIAALITRIEDLLRHREFAVVDALLGDQDVKAGDPIVPLTWLRITFPWRSRFCHWHSLRDRLAVELDRRGGDSSKTLMGLFGGETQKGPAQ